MRIATFTSLVVFAVVALAACSGARSERPGSEPEQVRTIALEESCAAGQSASDAAVDELTPRDVLRRVADALTCPDQVAHITARVEQGAEREPTTIEYWLDIPNGALRIHADQGVRYATVQIANDDGVFRRDSDEKPAEKSEHSPLCSEYDEPLLPYLLDDECFLLGSVPQSVETGEYDGRTALVVEAEQFFPAGPDEEDGIVEYDSRVYVDPGTFVLLGALVEARYEGQSFPELAAEYELDFVPLSALAADYFEPSSIGYVQPNAELDGLDGTVYWLGETLPAGDGFSELRIDDVWSPERLREPGSYIGILQYEPDVALHEYDVAKTDTDVMRYWQDPNLLPGECLAETVEVDLGGARGVIWGKSREKSDGTCGPATHYEARAFFDDTVVTVITSENTGAEFDSADGMERVLRGLKPRVAL